MDFLRTLKKRRPKQRDPVRVSAAPPPGTRRYAQRRIGNYLRQRSHAQK